MFNSDFDIYFDNNNNKVANNSDNSSISNKKYDKSKEEPLRYHSDSTTNKKRNSWRNRVKRVFYRFKGRVQSIKSKKMTNEHKFVTNESVWILGREWIIDENDIELSIERIKNEIRSRIWMTYRYNFPNIDHTVFTSDAGWGCMLRSGQMMMAQALLWHFLQRSWQYQPKIRSPTVYAQILRWFIDLPTPKCPYSIHNMLNSGKCFGKEIGEWFGPGEVAHMLEKCHKHHLLSSEICVLVCKDATIYREEVIKSLKRCYINKVYNNNNNNNNNDDDDNNRNDNTNKNNKNKNTKKEDKKLHDDNENMINCDELTEDIWCPLILFLPLRLGVDKINEGYLESLKTCIRMPQSLGFMGGKPRSSLYFIGYQDNRFLYLDPHTVQATISLKERLSDDSSTYHCSDKPRSLPLNRIDPSLALGFYCRHKKDYDQLCENWKTMSENDLSVFTMADKMPIYDWDDDVDEDDGFISSDPSSPIKSKSSNNNTNTTDDDFVLL